MAAKKRITRRSIYGIFTVGVAILLVGLVMIGKLFSLQIVQGEDYRKLAGARHYALKPTYPDRGQIYDSQGETLALTTYVYTIGITPKAVMSHLADPDQRPKREQIIDAFSRLLQLDRQKVAEAFEKTEATYVNLIKNISKEAYDPFGEYLTEYKIGGVAIDSLPKRFYPKKDLASQLIGFANLDEEGLIGINGIEASYNRALAGTPGYSYGEVDHYFGGQLPYSPATESQPVPGNNVVLYLNSKLQQEVQTIVQRYSRLFSASEGGSAIVMDMQTGGILAMAQEESYDLNQPYAMPQGLEHGAKAFYEERMMERGHDLKAERERIREARRRAKEGPGPKSSEAAEEKDPVEPDRRIQGPPTPRFLLAKLRAESSQAGEGKEEGEEKIFLQGLVPYYQMEDQVESSTWDPFQKTSDLAYLTSAVWRNQNVSFTYEPGSTMKTFTVSTAVEENAFRLDELFSDAPIWIRGFGDYAIHCHVFPNNHEYETVNQALGNSCNPVMVQLAERVGIEKFYRYVHSLGFYGLTGIDLPAEALGLMHSNPNVVDLAPMSFGESNTVTPIALAQAYSVIGNQGTMVKPQVAKYLTDKDGKVIRSFPASPVRQVYSPQTMQTVIPMLRDAFVNGIVNLANEPGYFAGGKSGTSTKAILDSEEQNYSVMSVAAVFPIDEPRYLVLGLLYDPNTTKSSCAQSMVRDIIRSTGRILNVPKRYTQADLNQALKPKEISTANGITLLSIADYLAGQDVEFELSPGMKYNDYFYTFYPRGKVPLNGYPVYYVSQNGDAPKEEVEVPDFTGKTFEEAASIAYQRRINIHYNGNPLTGVVVEQSVPALSKEEKSPNKMQKYGVVELTFGPLPGYNPPNIRMVENPLPEATTNLPIVTDPIWTTQHIYTPYGDVPEHNPYGG